MKPDYLVIGHIARDVAPSGVGFSPGGTVTYASITAQRLGLQAAVVTACASEDAALIEHLQREGIWVHAVSAQVTTTFRNTYDAAGQRTQLIEAESTPLRYQDIPQEWLRTPIVHLGPIAHELGPELPTRLSNRVLGVTPQGWLRSWDARGLVRQAALPVPEALQSLPGGAVLVLSMEDLGYNPAAISRYSELATVAVITGGEADALVFARGEEMRIPACSARSVDPTGAGDVFAAAFLVRYFETGDPLTSARFAHAAAACSIEREGTAGIADRTVVGSR